MPQRGDVRLSSYPAGRIEVFKDGKWGTVCGHYTWNNHHAAEVVCRRLGYRGGRTYKVSNSPNDLPIIVGWRICSGGEENLLECPLQDGRTEANEMDDCSHEIDVGASCTGSRVSDNFELRSPDGVPSGPTVTWAANRSFEISKFKFNISESSNLRTSQGPFSAVSKQASKQARSSSPSRRKEKRRDPGIRAQLKYT